jgi:dihydropteroate synthase
VRAALPGTPISIDTTKPEVAEAALAAGANLLNDVWGTAPDGAALAAVAATHRVPLILMHNRREPVYDDVVAEVVTDLAAAIERAVRVGMSPQGVIVDPGIGFAGSAHPARHLSKVHPWSHRGPAARRSTGGDPCHDGPGHRDGRGYDPGP